jgi:hypothetical protein
MEDSTQAAATPEETGIHAQEDADAFEAQMKRNGRNMDEPVRIRDIHQFIRDGFLSHGGAPAPKAPTDEEVKAARRAELEAQLAALK